MENHLTLSQFIHNTSDFLTDSTTLIFSSGNYSLESELIVENIHSFSMFVWSTSSSKAVITCIHNARFEFRNISIVTVSGLVFVGCRIISAGNFELKHSESEFFGSNQAIVNGTVLIIEESVASLDTVNISDLEILQTSAIPQDLPENCNDVDTTDTTDVVIGILLNRSVIRIIQSQFQEMKVGLTWCSYI